MEKLDHNDNWKLTTPVALIIFNRPDTTQKVFNAIREAKPPKLLVVADGARIDKEGEAELCQQTRAIIEQVDWDCEVLVNYSDVNLGCRRRVSSGLEKVGFVDVKVCQANESRIDGFNNYHLDILPDGKVRKNDSLFMEGMKPKN